ncbi:MAG TPA: chemotaxis protein CheW [Polyangiaceae bacterium]|jgi:two-component system chemotaxis sensor kinase CheA
MTSKVDLSEFLTAYIAEADEQLRIGNARLLAIEAASRKGEHDRRSLRELFRSMHTLKGLSSMVDVEPVVAIAHHVESVLREADRQGSALPVAASDVILRAIRAMEQRVRAMAAGKPPAAAPPDLVAALAAIAPGAAPAVERGPTVAFTLEPAVEQKLDGFERDLVVRGVSQGRRAVRLDYAPTAERAARGLSINTVRERLGALADIIRVVPLSRAAGARGGSAITFAILLVTDADDAALAAASGVDESAIVPFAQRAPSSEGSAAIVEDEAPDADLAEEVAPRANLLRVDARRLDETMDRLSSLIVTRSRIANAIARLAATGADTRELTQVAQENARQLRDLRASILQVRMVPVVEMLERLPLMVRSLMRTSGRQVRLEVEAAGAELDKAVAERLFPAIVHLVRNAVDHGIEPAEARIAAGKPAEGTIRIACSARSSTRLELVIADDGRGIDGAALARRAGVPVPDGEISLLELLCRPGLSTRDEATTTSGRGLGMDIVKRTVEGLGGEITLRTGAGQGTTFTLRVPLTVAIVDAFVVECAGERMVVPVSVIDEIVEVEPEQVVRPPHADDGVAAPLGIVERRGESMVLYSLASLLGSPPGAEGPVRKALVVRRAGEPVGFVLDRVLGQQEAVVRPLVDPLVRVPGISAATDLGDGRPTLVLDLLSLLGRVRRRPALLAQPAQPRPLLAGGTGGAA